MKEYPLCKDCKHYSKQETVTGIFGLCKNVTIKHLCNRDSKQVKSLVTGSSWIQASQPHDCEFERGYGVDKGSFMDGHICTYEGIYWEAK